MPPAWLPPGVTFESLPNPVQQAVRDVLTPAYEQQVLKADDALEKAQGLSLCYHLFFEIVTMFRLVGRSADRDWAQVVLSKGLTTLMNISAQKNKIANSLLALRKFRERLEAGAVVPGAPPQSAKA